LEKEAVSVVTSLWETFKELRKEKFEDLIGLSYINDENLEVPENKIAIVQAHPEYSDHSDAVSSLKGNPGREWFAKYASFCLPLTIANQQGFVIKAMHDAEIFWDGESFSLDIKSNGLMHPVSPQIYATDFGPGVLTIDHRFVFRTPPGINLMTIQPPNYFIEGLHVMAGTVESDNLRRSFTFNIKVTSPNKKIYIKKGDWLAAFIPVQRNFIEKFELVDADKLFSDDIINNEQRNMVALGYQRNTHQDFGGDVGKINDSGRRYFKGIHADGTKYKDHQKRIE